MSRDVAQPHIIAGTWWTPPKLAILDEEKMGTQWHLSTDWFKGRITGHANMS
jgi:hypothetical protein